jgi:hypothetical protein
MSEAEFVPVRRATFWRHQVTNPKGPLWGKALEMQKPRATGAARLFADRPGRTKVLETTRYRRHPSSESRSSSCRSFSFLSCCHPFSEFLGERDGHCRRECQSNSQLIGFFIGILLNVDL